MGYMSKHTLEDLGLVSWSFYDDEEDDDDEDFDDEEDDD